jgi:hypothetical protein
MGRTYPTLMLSLGLLALTPTAFAQTASDDLAALETEVSRLETEVEGLEPGDPNAERFRERATELREELIYLKVKSRRHREAGRSGSGVEAAELAEFRRRFSDLRSDLDRAFGRRVALEVPAGTGIQVSLEDPLSSRTARVEDRVSTLTVRDVLIEGRVAIPAGTQIRGIVREVEPARRPSKAGRLMLEFDALFIDGDRHDLVARVSEIQEGSGAARKAGIGAVVGAVVGGILGGKDGAIAGVLIGGGGAVAGSRGEDVELPAGSVVTIRLERGLVVPGS